MNHLSSQSGWFYLSYCACVVGIYKVALTHKKLGITKELLANRVVPFLFPLCIDSGLNLTQVSSFTVYLLVCV